MSIAVTLLARLGRFNNPVLKNVAKAMADYANDDGAGIYPSNGTLAADTDYSQRTVVRALGDLKKLGIIRIDEQSLGGAHKDTTVRSFDLDVLRSISRGSKRHGIEAGPQHVVAVGSGEDKTFTLAAFKPSADDVSDDEIEPGTSGRPMTGSHPCQADTGDRLSPLPCQGVTPPMTGSHPNHQEPPRSTLSPLPPRGRRGEASFEIGLAKGWSAAARAALDELRDGSVTRAHVATQLLDPVAGTIGPPRDVDGAAYVRQVAARLGGYSAEVLAAVADTMLATRVRDLPPVIELERAAKAAAVKLGDVPGTGLATAKPVLVRKGTPEWQAYLDLITPEDAKALRNSSQIGVPAVLHQRIVARLANGPAAPAHTAKPLDA